MMLYTRIAAEIPAGIEITRKLIKDKYDVNYEQARAAIRILLKIGAGIVTKWHGKSQHAYELLPSALEIAQAYEKKTSSWNKPAEKKTTPLTPRSKDKTDIAEYHFTEKQNRLMSAFTTAQRELRESNGVYFNG
ncbi:TPA: hypothetical protein ACRRWQ_000789 [Morganella morganii]